MSAEPLASIQFRAISQIAWKLGDSEGEIDGLGHLRVHTLRDGDGRNHSRIYWLNGKRRSGASIMRAALAGVQS
jgi:hypothetical protein